jgi:transcriptional regulator with XRE-family HTH domain
MRLNTAQLRADKGLSQSELSRISGVKQGVISDIESGQTLAPRLDTAKKLADALGCSVDDLLKSDDPS